MDLKVEPDLRVPLVRQLLDSTGVSTLVSMERPAPVRIFVGHPH